METNEIRLLQTAAGTVDTALEEEEQRNKRLIHIAAPLAIFIATVYMLFYLSKGWWSLIVLNVPICIGLTVVYRSRKIPGNALAALFFCILTTIIYLIPNLFLGRESGIHYFLLCIIPFLFIVFPQKKDLKYIMLIGITDLLAFVFTEYVPFSQPFKLDASPAALKIMHMTTTVGMILIISALVLVLYLDINKAKKALYKEHKRSESLLLNILPTSIANRLKASPDAIAETFREASVLFADIAEFTALAGKLTPDDVVTVLNRYFTAYDELAEKHAVEKIKTIGDAYMAASGIPERRNDHAEALLGMASDMLRTTKQISSELGLDLEIRIGINSGPVTAGVIGKKKFIYDLWGDAVNIASRMESHGIPGRIQVGPGTYHLVKDKVGFEHRGRIGIKGKGDLDVYLVKGSA